MKRCLNCMWEYGEQFEVCPHCGYIEGTPPKEIYYLTPGIILNERYVVGTICGAGGFGIVYRAWDTTLEKIVAIKEYYPAVMAGRTPGSKEVYIYAKKREKEYRAGRERFLEEARNMARFSTHPNIVNVYNFFEENGTAYFVMEYLDGMTYKEYIKQNGGIVSEEIAGRIAQSVLDALTDIHKAGIIHRDIAPDNVFILKNGTIKLNDFGAAIFPKGNVIQEIQLKPGFAPPEQYNNKSRQAEYTDIYALGAMLYRSVTGIMPPESTDRIHEDGLTPPKALNPEISDRLNNIILRAMAVQPELRFQNTVEFKEALRSKKIVADAEKELKKRRKNRLMGIAAAVGFLVLTGIVSFSVYQNKKAQTVLKAAEIEMWVTAENGETENTKKVYEELLSDFRQDYPQISVEVVVIPEEEYADRINFAIEEKKLPALFESSNLEENELRAAKDVSRIFDWLDIGSYYGLREYSIQQGKHLKFPVSFYIPLLYVKGTEGEIATEELQHTEFCSEEILQKFLAGESDFYLGDFSSYHEINASLAGRYHLQKIPDTVMPKGNFAISYSIGAQGTKQEQNAAYRLLYYLLAEEAQYEFCIESQPTMNYGIPLQKSLFEVWLRINMEMKDKVEYVPILTYEK